MLPPPNGARDHKLEQHQADAVLAAAVADDQRFGRSLIAPLVALLAGAGVRIGEASALTWGAGVNLTGANVGGCPARRRTS